MFSTIRDAVLGFLESILELLFSLFEPIFGVHSWGWAIVALTLLVRIALLPLAIKQTRSMRAMQAIQPQMKELQKKYKVDRELMRKDPEAYRAKKAKLNEEMMALYQREGVNPAASCLPLLAQAPIFLALFWTLQRSDDLAGAPFYFFTAFVGDGSTATGLAATVSEAGWPGWLLIVLMSGTMFLSQKQMMAKNAAQMADNPMAQQQKILLYVMPVFLAVISFRFPLGILLYWVTTNVWQVAQQWIILREVQHEVETGEIANKPGGGAAKPKKGPKNGGKGPKNGGGNGSDAGDKRGGKGTGKGTGKGATSGGPRSGPATTPDAGTSAPRGNDGNDRAGSDPSSGGDTPSSNGDTPSSGGETPPASGAGQTPPPRSRKRSSDHLPRRRGRDEA